MDRYLTSLEKGEPLDVEQLCAEHPELASGIHHYLEGLEFIHDAATGLRAPRNRTGTGASTTPQPP